MKRAKRQKTKIRIKISQKKIRINKKKLTLLAKRILKIKGLKSGAELSIVFVGTRRIRGLNKRFRNKDVPTDVLAFSMLEGKGVPPFSEILGDLVICPEIARKSARIYKTTTEQEICLYLIHGILHLLGFDDSNVKNRSLMEREQDKILKKIMKHGKTKYYSKF